MSQSKFNRQFALLATALVTTGVIAGFWRLGSPNTQRQIRLDHQRIEDIRQIALSLYQQAQQAQNRGKPVNLPASLLPAQRRIEPISGEAYKYRRLDRAHYQLCANFATDSASNRLGDHRPANQDLWHHPAGQHCFKLNVLESPPEHFIYE